MGKFKPFQPDRAESEPGTYAFLARSKLDSAALPRSVRFYRDHVDNVIFRDHHGIVVRCYPRTCQEL